MHTIVIPYTIPAGGITPNLFLNTSMEFHGQAAVLTLYGAADATGDALSLQSLGMPAPRPLVTDAGGAGRGPDSHKRKLHRPVSDPGRASAEPAGDWHRGPHGPLRSDGRIAVTLAHFS